MKLRNKKTGEIIESACIGVFKHQSSGECERVDTEARSLEKVLEVWEDYKPAEPLIKDEKIRKAVRAWAEACNAEKAYLDTENEEGSTFYIYKFQSNCNFMQIATHDPNPLEGRRAYTITELCGEEEE